MSEENKEQTVEISGAELQDYLMGLEDSEAETLDSGSSLIPPFMIDLEDYDVEEFKRGVKDYSYKAGAVTALLNAGVNEQFVLDMLLNEETIRHNIKTAEINRDMNVEISKNSKVSAEKMEL